LQQGPLTLPGLQTDMQEHRAAVVQLIRDVVRPEMHHRVDTEMLLILAAGMRGFIDDDERAIQQVLYDYGLMLETLGWASSEWVTAVSEFSLLSPRRGAIDVLRPRPTSKPVEQDLNDLILIRRTIMNTPQSDSAPYTLSEETRARIILMAAEEQISFAQAADVITGYYESAMKSFGAELHDLHSILTLSKDLKMREISVKLVKLTLQLLGFLREHQLDMEHFEAAISLLARLHESGLTSQSPEAGCILDVASELVTSGVPPIEVEEWLAQRLKAPGR